VSTEVKKEIELEIAYVLFIDIVGYSKLVTHEQRRLLELLNQIVREAEHFRAAIAGSPCPAGTVALVLAGVVCRGCVLRERRQGEYTNAK
jgi:hypothetical protein